MKFTKDQLAAVQVAFPSEWDADEAEADAESLAVDILSGSEAVDELYAWGPGEPYAISIRGVPGAYFATAPEYDEIGVFSTVEEALKGVEERWDGICLFASEEDAWAAAEREGFI